MSHADRMRQIELADAQRFIKRLAAEDAQLGLGTSALPAASLHTPKRGVKRSGHLGSHARRTRDRAHGAAAMPQTQEQRENLANGYVPHSYLSNIHGVVYVSHTRESRAAQTTPTQAATQPEASKIKLDHDFNN